MRRILLSLLIALAGCCDLKQEECKLVFHDSSVKYEMNCSRKLRSAIVVCGDYLKGPTYDGVKELSCRVIK